MGTTVQPDIDGNGGAQPIQSPAGPTIVGVRFQTAGKPYHFSAPGTLTLAPQDWVVVETVYGEQVGQVTHLPDEEPSSSRSRKLRPVLRQASGLDMARHRVMLQRAERLVEVAQEEVRTDNLDFKVISAELTLDNDAELTAVAHSLGRVPSKVEVILRANTATAQGWADNEETVFPLQWQGTNAHDSVSITFDGTNVTIVQGNAIQLVDHTSFLDEDITQSQYNWVVRAWA